MSLIKVSFCSGCVNLAASSLFKKLYCSPEAKKIFAFINNVWTSYNVWSLHLQHFKSIGLTTIEEAKMYRTRKEKRLSRLLTKSWIYNSQEKYLNSSSPVSLSSETKEARQTSHECIPKGSVILFLVNELMRSNNVCMNFNL